MKVDVANLHRSASFHALRGEWQKAEPLLRAARVADPDHPQLRHAHALALLALGRLREGLPLYAYRWSVPGLGDFRPKIDCPEWQGEDLSRRHILVFPEQGLGDQVMFARWIPLLKARAGDVTVICLPPLVRLFEVLGVRVLPAAGQLQFPDPHYWTLVADLPLKLGAFDIPQPPYLRGSPKGSGGVGIMRRGNPLHPNDANRSLPEDLVVPFPTVSLDPADTGASDMQDTADIIAGLEAVVTVDTSVAHVAGALGKSVHILLPASGTDWRWGSRGVRTHWYPSARLYRQKRAGDWRRELEAVGQNLR